MRISELGAIFVVFVLAAAPSGVVVARPALTKLRSDFSASELRYLGKRQDFAYVIGFDGTLKLYHKFRFDAVMKAGNQAQIRIHPSEKGELFVVEKIDDYFTTGDRFSNRSLFVHEPGNQELRFLGPGALPVLSEKAQNLAFFYPKHKHIYVQPINKKVDPKVDQKKLKKELSRPLERGDHFMARFFKEKTLLYTHKVLGEVPSVMAWDLQTDKEVILFQARSPHSILFLDTWNGKVLVVEVVHAETETQTIAFLLQSDQILDRKYMKAMYRSERADPGPFFLYQGESMIFIKNETQDPASPVTELAIASPSSTNVLTEQRQITNLWRNDGVFYTYFREQLWSVVEEDK